MSTPLKTIFTSWQAWAPLPASFAALTAIFAKVGAENVSSDFATFIRTVVILAVTAGIVFATGQFHALGTVSGRTHLFLVHSGLATGASWLCCFRALKLGNAARVAPRRWERGPCHADAVFRCEVARMSNGMAVARIRSRAEFAADRLVHIVGLAVGGAGVIVLSAIAALHGRWPELITVGAYSVGLIAMLSFSAAYNLAVQSRHRDLLRRFDHAGIFIMIAGTYTPFTVLGLSGGRAIGMTTAAWAIAALGILLKMTLPQRRREGLSIALYLAFGWMGLIVIGPLLASVGLAILVVIAAGGVVYSLGVIFHAWKGLPYQNAIWHGFVLAAAGIHYGAIMGVVVGSG